MQFTVLIEFLIPGLATVLLCLALLPCDMAQRLREAVPTGDAAIALALLAVSYPVGHLINFPIYRLFQWKRLAPRARRRTLEKLPQGVNLAERVSRELGFRVGAGTNEELRELFYYMQTITFSRNIEQFNTHDLFHKSLQRLARGMLFPLLLVGFLGCAKGDLSPLLSLLIVLLVLFSIIVSICLWIHFVQIEENEIVRFFLVSTATPEHSHGR